VEVDMSSNECPCFYLMTEELIFEALKM